MNKLIVTLLSLLMVVFSLNAQDKVTGVVSDENGEPLPGVGILIKGTNTGVSSNVDGSYSISATDLLRGGTLVFMCVGMDTEEVPVNGRAVVNVKMKTSAHLLDDVVVIGYGTVKRADVTGSISSVSSDDIMKTPVNNISEAISGKMAGVQIVSSDGAPDADVSILVRGRGSITQSNDPLYIVDGFQVTSISDISPSDIQSIDVLKDASATAIYGSRGANGVVMITTKSAQKSGIDVSFNAYLGLKYVQKMPEVMDPYEYAKLQYERAIYYTDRDQLGVNYYPYYGSFEDMDLYKTARGNDWQKIVFGRSALVQNYNVSLNGKTDKMSYSASYTRAEDEGVMITSDFVRDNFTFKMQHRPNKNFVIDFQTRFSNREVKGGGTRGSSVMKSIMQYSPIPLSGFQSDDIEDSEMGKINGFFSPTDEIRDNNRKQKSKNITFSGGVRWNIIENLSFSTNVNYDLRWDEDQQYYGVTTSYSRMTSPFKDQPALQYRKVHNSRITNNNTLSYDFAKILPEKHKLNILLGEEMDIVMSERFSTRVDGFPLSFTSDEVFKFVTEGTPVSASNFYATPERLLSFFGRINYEYNNRYLFTATMRADGSSKFNKSHPWGYFPSAAFAWKISEEPFMSNATSVSNMKFRLSWGLTGNDNIPSGQTVAEFTSSSTPDLPFGDSVPMWGLGDSMTNADLKWESTESRNVGLDFGFFKDRLSFTVDLYHNVTRNQLIKFPVTGSGYKHQYRNMGTTMNAGAEFSINAVIVEKRDYGLTFNFNIAANKNKVLDLGGLEYIQANSGAVGGQTDYDFLVMPGYSLGMIYGFICDGRHAASDFIWDNKWIEKEGVVNNVYATRECWGPGSIKLRDISGDKVIKPEDDRTLLGCTLPKATGGFALSGYAKGFDLNANFTYSIGNKILNANKAAFAFTHAYPNQNLLAEMNSSNRWTSIDDSGMRVTDTKLLDEMNANTTMWSPMIYQAFVSSYLVEDGSFLRLNSLTVGYSLSTKATGKMHIKKLRFYVTGTNLFCVTKYTGFDPEVDCRRDTPMTPGVDYSPYPRTRGFIGGINFTF